MKQKSLILIIVLLCTVISISFPVQETYAVHYYTYNAEERWSGQIDGSYERVENGTYMDSNEKEIPYTISTKSEIHGDIHFSLQRSSASGGFINSVYGYPHASFSMESTRPGDENLSCSEDLQLNISGVLEKSPIWNLSIIGTIPEDLSTKVQNDVDRDIMTNQDHCFFMLEDVLSGQFSVPLGENVTSIKSTIPFFDDPDHGTITFLANKGGIICGADTPLLLTGVEPLSKDCPIDDRLDKPSVTIDIILGKIWEKVVETLGCPSCPAPPEHAFTGLRG